MRPGLTSRHLPPISLRSKQSNLAATISRFIPMLHHSHRGDHFVDTLLAMTWRIWELKKPAYLAGFTFHLPPNPEGITRGRQHRAGGNVKFQIDLCPHWLIFVGQ
jgi:hypothetical protein